MNRIRLLLPFAGVAVTAALVACSGGLERYPAAIDYDQLELRKSAILDERSRLPAAHRDDHSEMLEQMERRVAQVKQEEQVMRTRRMEFLEKANREQSERFRAWEGGHQATAEQRAAFRAKRYPTREEGLELLRRSDQALQARRDELQTRYSWSQGALYTGGPDRIQREAAVARARYEERKRVESAEGQRVLEVARRALESKEQANEQERDRNREYAVQEVKALSIPAQPDVAASSPNQRSGAGRSATGAAAAPRSVSASALGSAAASTSGAPSAPAGGTSPPGNAAAQPAGP